MGFDYVIKLLLSLIKPCTLYKWRQKPSFSCCDPREDSFLTSVWVMNLNHRHLGISGRKYDFRKMILIFSSAQIQLWPACNTSGKVTQRKQKTPFTRSLLKRVFPPNPCWWLPKASKHDILCNYLRMIRSMQAILFFFFTQGHKGRSFTDVNISYLHNTWQQD